MGTRPRDSDAFLSYLYGVYPGQASDRQRWMAWAAMVTLLAKAAPSERRRWQQAFYQLSQIEHNNSLSEAERGQAFVDLLKSVWPRPIRRGRKPDDCAGLLNDFPVIRNHLARSWADPTSRRRAVAEVERSAQLDLSRETQDEGEILSEVVESTPERAALLILARAYEQDVRTVAQQLRRAQRRQSSR